MQARPLILTLFPLSLVAIAITERAALLWLGAAPASPTAWEFWLNLHALSGRAWVAMEPALGSGMATQFLGLIAVVIALLTASRSRGWRAWSFLHNHAALLAAAVLSLLQMQGNVSSLDAVAPSQWALAMATQLSPLQIAMIVCGLASCTLCHATMIAQVRDGKARSGNAILLQQAKARP